MSENNTALWDRLGRTNPVHTKPFKRAGGFEGTAIKPMFSYRRMTEEFGPCGIGWGVDRPDFQVVPAAEGEMLVFCTVSVWYTAPAKPSPINQQMGVTSQLSKAVFGVGGDKVVGKNKYGLSSDDEAFKKAYTDAVTNALKLIGVGADVHMGMFDDSKYINTMTAEFSAQKQEAPVTPPKASSASQKKGLLDIDADLIDCHSILDVDKCAKVWAEIMKRDGWAKDFIDIARPKFQARRDEIHTRVQFEADAAEQFPEQQEAAE